MIAAGAGVVDRGGPALFWGVVTGVAAVVLGGGLPLLCLLYMFLKGVKLLQNHYMYK